jgi:nitrous oxidase accessory protein NosD
LKVLVSVLTAACCLLASPGLAGAATFAVDSIDDEADTGGLNGVCLSAGLKCTLRAAIEESNVSTGTKDTITFASNPFNGQGVDTIPLTLGSLPLIIDPVHIDADSAGQCVTEAGQAGPCAGVNGPATGSAFAVEADGVEIDGLAITSAAGTGASSGIFAVNGASGLVARDNWLGVKLDGTAAGNSKGIYLDPNSNGATIGGTSVADRNVFGNNSAEGLDIEGADNADVLGNYFGVKPDGATQAPNGKNVEITNTAAFEANGDEVGTTVEGAAATSQACDGGCNVISGSTGPGIDLVGDGIGQNELPASGPTTVHGNFVGLNSAGVTTVSAGPLFDILAGAAKDVTVGGPAAADANYIAGGSYGIYQENSNGFQALGNVIGRRPGGAGVAAPGSAGIFLFSLGSTGRETVEGNTIRLDGGTGIEQRFGGADIAGNLIEEGQYGILTFGAAGAAGGNAIEENTIEGAELSGVLIKNENNLLVGNLIEGASQAAIRIEGATGTGTLIGGDLESEENEISANGGDAIEVVDDEVDDTQIKRNFGDGNAGLFIDLGADGAGNGGGGPNNGIQPPTISSATENGASGTALPGATVRVFRKATASPGELQSFLGKATADGGGKWSLSYGAAIPGGTHIGATQSELEGTSELAFAFASTVVVDGGCAFIGGPQCETKKDGSGGTHKGKGKGKGKDKTAPQTTIVKKRIKGRTAKFKFVSSEAGSTFQCKLDKRPFKPCRSPKRYKHLKPGMHVFEVRAVDAAGNRDKTPATRRFRVLPRR